MPLGFGACQTQGASEAAFYRGLVAEAGAGEAGNETRDEVPAAYFERALRSKNAFIREAAAQKLPPRLPDSGAAALILGEPADRVLRWVPVLSGAAAARFSPAEYAAIQGRFAVARSAFGAALAHFRTALETDPPLFLRYPETLTDLGRSFQFGGSGDEGSLLFQEWEHTLETEEANALRYRLRYFAGRIDRQRGNYRRSTERFDGALELAPDTRQSDACIWYILHMTLEHDPGGIIPALERYLPRVTRFSVVEDILEPLARVLVAERRWESLLQVYALLPPHLNASSRARYAYILGRAADRGFLRGHTGGEPFFRAARGEEGASLYYRALASWRLDGPALEIPGETGEGAKPPAAEPGSTFAPVRGRRSRSRPTPEAGGPPPATPPTGVSPPAGALADPRAFPHRDAMAFLLGFFKHHAARFAWPYIAALTDDLDIPELRVVARALQDAGRWDESLKLAAAWMEKDGYRLNRADMELYYPRPFREAVEKYAAEEGIAPWLFYGLIRTESAFMAGIRSGAGAVGLTQLMPDTAAEMAGRLRRQTGEDLAGEGGLDLANPDTNLRLGALYLRYLEDRLETPLLSLFAYNGGLSRVRRWRRAQVDLPLDLFAETVEFRETRVYGRRVSSAAAAYGYLYYGLTMESILSDILN
jgi:soluble lytic murein transglycosylase